MPKFISDDEMNSLEVSTGAKFISDEDMDKMEPSYLESGARGLAQGASLGFADEITGGLESFFTDKSYEQARDESRANYKSAEEANPKTFGAGEIGGNVATAFVPGMNIAKGAGLAKAALQSGVLGGLAGAGHSEAKDLTGLAQDTGKGIALGGGLGVGAKVAAPMIGKALGGMGQGVQNVVDDVATAPLGKESSRGMVAGGLDMAHRVGKKGNQLFDDALKAITPSTGSESSDAMLKTMGQGVSKLGRYTLAGKAQAGVDALEHGPKAVQWAAQKASPMVEKLRSTSGYGADLASRNPQVFNTIANKLENRFASSEKKTAPDSNDLLQKTQGTKYAQVLQGAAQRGGSAVGSTHFILQSTDPEYRKLFMDEEDQL